MATYYMPRIWGVLMYYGNTRKMRRRIAWVIITLVGLVIVYWLNRATIPVQCRVSVEHMSQDCRDFLFPK